MATKPSVVASLPASRAAAKTARHLQRPRRSVARLQSHTESEGSACARSPAIWQAGDSVLARDHLREVQS